MTSRLVADASAVAEVLVGARRERSVVAELSRARRLLVPEHFHVEVLAAIRRAEMRGDIDRHRAARAVGHLTATRLLRRPTAPLASAIWELRHRLTVQDAAYVVLARSHDAPLVTLDAGQAQVARELGVTVVGAE